MTRILIVDDEPADRARIHAYLGDTGYELVDAPDGATALELIGREPIDLVVLDMLIPDVDGLAVTRALRETPRPVFLPVILMTGADDRDARLRGLEAGANDFVSKPLDPHELMLRVRNLLALRDREASLVELRRFRDQMIELLLHDLRDPLAALLADLGTALDMWPDQDALEAVREAEAACRKMTDLVRDVTDSQRLAAAALKPLHADVAIGALLDAVIASRGEDASVRRIALGEACSPGLAIVADPELLRRALENLVDVAVRSVAAGDTLTVDAAITDGLLRIRVGAAATPLPARLALGLQFCRLAVEAHGGRLSLDERGPSPAAYVVELPAS